LAACGRVSRPDGLNMTVLTPRWMNGAKAALKRSFVALESPSTAGRCGHGNSLREKLLCCEWRKRRAEAIGLARMKRSGVTTPPEQQRHRRPCQDDGHAFDCKGSVRKHPFQSPPWYQSPKGPFCPLQSRGSRSFEASNHSSAWNFSLRTRTLAATLHKRERLRSQGPTRAFAGARFISFWLNLSQVIRISPPSDRIEPRRKGRRCA
jgi:hypothetical protein